ncbi:MAG TPA: hypothetical protein VEG44_06570 [Candidatus Acidoferrales bacterium]|nr:hypothetical protein [Candidatus Acidoferrales bacterium]
MATCATSPESASLETTFGVMSYLFECLRWPMSYRTAVYQHDAADEIEREAVPEGYRR